MSLETTVQDFTEKTEELLTAVNLRKVELDAAKNAAASSAQGAFNSAATATTKAAEAATSASSAAASKTSSDLSRDAAATSAEQAGASAVAAAASAVAASDFETGAGENAAAASAAAADAATAKSGSEAARNASVAARTASEAARDAAVTAKTAAETAETNAETAEAAAEAAQAAAETARTAAQTSAAQASASKDAAALSATAAATSATEADADRAAAQTARTGSETARDAAVLAQTATETARNAAQTAQAGAETARTGAETAQTGAQTAETNAETAQGAAEAARDLAQMWAENPAGEAVVEEPEEKFSALHWAAQSETSSQISGSYASSAGDAARSAQQAAKDAVAVATGGTASLTAAAGKIPIAGANGKIDYSWFDTIPGVTAEALHRSPNPITAMFVYDTSKDSDGGAWTEKCQHTSWYNEPLSGKWLGAHASEIDARYSNITLGSELLTNRDFSNGSTGWTLSAMTVVDGMVTGSGSGGVAITQSVPLTAGKLYRVEYKVRLTTTLVTVYARLNSADINYGANVGASTAFNTIVQYVVASSGTSGFQLVVGNVGTGNTIYFDNISCREVISVDTASNDYFQLTTNGKFYRLWKNLLEQSTDLTKAVNGELAASTLTANTIVFTAPTAFAGMGSNASFSGFAGQTFTASVTLSSPDGKASVGLWAKVWGNKGATGKTVQLTATPTRHTISVTATAAFSMGIEVVLDNRVSANGDGTTSGTIVATDWQMEYGSSATDYEAKNSQASVTEIFRGNKADFPRLAAVISEGLTVSIYDLTEAGRPMWMRFVGTSGYTLDVNAAYPISSLAAINGKIIVGSKFPNNSSDGSGIVVLDFPRDGSTATALYGSTDRQNLSNRTAPNSGTSPSAIFPHPKPGNINAIAMTVLPDAPIDPSTGLRVPTIALATGSGITVIKQDGTTVSNTGASENRTIAINKDMVIGTTYASSQYQLNPGSLTNNFSLTSNAFSLGSSPDYYRSAWHVGNKLTGKTKVVSGSMYGPVATQALVNLANRARSITSIATNTFNTGWLPGDIRRAYLSDTEAATASGAELVTNGSFDTDATGWTVLGGATVSGGTLNVSTATAEYWIVRQTLTIRPGQIYRVKFDITSLANNGGPAYVGIGWGVTNGIQNYSTAGTKSLLVTATGTSVVLCFYFINATASIDNVSVMEVVPDRSYKAQSAQIYGVLTKSQLAIGTSLVGYAGFNAANYLREAYSADLDFGTGECSSSAWVNPPSSSPVNVNANLIAAPEDFNSSVWDRNGTMTIVANSGVDPFGGNAATRFGTDWRLFFYLNTRIYVEFTTYTFSIYAKADVGTVFQIRVADMFAAASNTTVSYDLSAGTVSHGFASIQSVGSGWYRCSFTATVNGQYPYFELRTTSLANTVLLYGAKLNKGTSPGTYTPGKTAMHAVNHPIAERAHTSGPALMLALDYAGRFVSTAFDGTTTRSVTTTATYNIATWLKAEACYTTDGTLSIRLNGREVAATRGNPLLSLNSRYNLLTYSQDFDNAVWTKNSTTVTANAIAAPDGTTTADLYTAVGTGASRWFFLNTTLLPSATRTHSIYVKKGTAPFFFVGPHNGSGNVNTWFNLDTGAVGTNAAGSTATIQSVGNGWYRVSVTRTEALNYFLIGFSDADNSQIVTDGATGYVWGAQLETGSTAKTYQRVGAAADFDFQAPLTIGNSYALDASFPGSIALLKLSATVPTAEQSQFMYEQEKQLFRPGAQAVLPDSGAIVDMAYDDATDRWVSVSASNESYWTGLVRNSVTPVPAGSYTKIAATSGVELVARGTTSPGVDVTLPAAGLREELVKRAEAAARLTRELTMFDYVGGFTANTTNGSTAITNVSTITYPASYIGARISGSGIPANTTIVAVSGTTIYLSAAATATATGVSISFLDFELPAGFETKAVLAANAPKQEGATKDYTRLYDGFIETVRFAVAPGATAWVQIQAQRVTI